MFKNTYAFDIETTGLNPHTGSRAFAYCVGHPSGTVDVFQMNRKGRRNLKDFFQDTSMEKVGHNIKFDLSFMPYHNIEIPSKTIIHDTMVQSQLIRNLAPQHSLDYLAWELFGWERETDKQIKREGNALGGYQNIEKRKMNKYQIADGKRCQILHQGFFPSIHENDKLYADYLIEMRLIFVTMRLESYGISLHQKNCNKLIAHLENELDYLNDELYEHLGYRANLGSSIQVQKILFQRLQMKPLKKNKEGYVTDMDTINHLRATNPHPILDLILKYRTYTKGTAMVGSYLDIADSNPDKLIFPNIKCNGAKRTGRESSENPNLQNVSKSTNLTNPYTVAARSAFRSRPKHVLFLVDYAGIEMRLIVDASGCILLKEIINKGGDVHLPAAKCFYGDKFFKRKHCFEYMFKLNKKNKKIVKDLVGEYGPLKGKRLAHDKFKKVLRGIAKNGHFAVAYGSGKGALAKTLQLSVPDTEAGFLRYAEKYPEVAYFTKNVVKEVKENGFVITNFGRKLYCAKSKAFQGANYKIQGYAAGILKRAQVFVDEWLKVHYPDIRIVIPIHDELLISFPMYLLPKVKSILKKISQLMINIPGVSIRLDVEWKKTVTTWDKAKEYEVAY